MIGPEAVCWCDWLERCWTWPFS